MPRRGNTTPKCEPCNKLLYPTEDLAYGVALNVSGRRGGAYRVYPCYAGQGGFHITSKRKGGVRNG